MRIMVGIAAVVIVLVLIGFLWLVPRKNAMPATQQTLTPAQYRADFVQGSRAHLLLDVRTPEEFASGHIPGARNISLQTLPQRLAEVPHDQPVVIYCRSGNRSKQAMQLLAQSGYDEVYDLGGIIEWQAQGLPVQ